MAVDTLDQDSRPTGLPAALPFAIAGVLFAVILIAGAGLLNDPDAYWHLAVGRWIVENRALPSVDPFSFTAAGTPWIAKEWLSQFLYDGAFALAGWGGVAVLAAAAAALAFGLLARALGADLAPAPVLILAAAAFLLSAPHLLARPHVLAMPVMVAWVAGLVRAADRGTRPSPWLLPLMVLWANLHGGFTLGLVLTVAAGLDAVVSARPGTRRSLALGWAAFTVLALAAACVTPYGPQSMLVTFRILGLGPALSLIGEWRPADFSAIGGLEVVLLAGLALALWRGFILPPVRILILLGLIHMALSAGRNAELLGLLAPLFLARPLAVQVPRLAATGDSGPRLAGAWLVAFVAFLAPVALGFPAVRALAPAPRVSPEAAVLALKAIGARHVLDDYDFGGYLVFAGIPPFVDGRTELYGGPFVARHHAAVTLADPADLVTLLDQYRIDATLLAPATPAVAFLDRLPGWRRAYADSIAVVHVRAASP